MSSAVKAYTKLPVPLYRMTLGGKIRIRKSYDIAAEGPNEIVKPKHQDLKNYKGPNGASMRPLTSKQIKLIETYKGTNVEVAYIPAGTELPKELIILHEWTQGTDAHYSLQPRQEMKLSDFQTKVQDFLTGKSSRTTRINWLLKNRAPAMAKGPKGEELKWNFETTQWYYTDSVTKQPVTVPFK